MSDDHQIDQSFFFIDLGNNKIAISKRQRARLITVVENILTEEYFEDLGAVWIDMDGFWSAAAIKDDIKKDGVTWLAFAVHTVKTILAGEWPMEPEQ